MIPDEDIAYEMNRELGQAEQREIDRRVERALTEQEPDDDEIAEGRLRALDYDAWADL